MSTDWDILAELDRLIEDEMTTKPPEAIRTTPVRTVPGIGTLIQRSDAQNRRKAEMLLTPPPPPPRGKGKQKPASRTTRAEAPATTARKRPRIQPAVVPAAIRPATAAPPTNGPPPTLLTAATAARRAPPPSEPPPLAVFAATTRVAPPATAPAPTPPPAAGPPPGPPTVYGPAGPPPLMVEYAPGEFAAVPYFAATKARLYRVRAKNGDRYKLRFSANGRLQSSRKMPPQASGS